MNGDKILYLGDSENDNPAFRRVDVSIGVISDDRLNPKLDCEYTVSFDQLSVFLKALLDKDFVFSDDLLPDQIKMMTFRSSKISILRQCCAIWILSDK